MDKQLDALAGKVATAMRGYVLRSLGGLVKRLEEVENRQPEKGDKGDAGQNGIDGKDADPAFIEAAIKQQVERVLATWNRPCDGIDGKSVDMAEVQQAIEAAALKAVSDMPKPKDGEPGRDGRDGERGLDALRVEVLDGIDVERRYPKGTYAYWRGGTIRAQRATDPLGEGSLEKAGWHVVLNGTASKSIEHSDDLRTITFREEMTDGSVAEKMVKVPVAIDRGIFKADHQYATGDAVTWDGSLSIAQRPTKGETPGTSDAWRLAVRRGQNGRDGLKGDPGTRGADGRAGRDLTQMGLDGKKY